MIDIETEKMLICRDVSEALEKICPGIPNECTIKGCQLLNRCNRKELDPTNKSFTLKRLRKFAGTINQFKKFTGGMDSIAASAMEATHNTYFVPQETEREKWLRKKIKEYLGDINEHELLKNEPGFIKKINSATNLKQVLRVMDEAYLKKHGKMYKSFGKGYGPDWKEKARVETQAV